MRHNKSQSEGRDGASDNRTPLASEAPVARFVLGHSLRNAAGKSQFGEQREKKTQMQRRKFRGG